MKRSILLIVFLSVFSTLVNGQEPVYLTFTSIFQAQTVEPERITITNLTNGGDTTLFWPDTTLAMIPVRTVNLPLTPQKFTLYQNFPNPIGSGSSLETSIQVYLPSSGILYLNVADLSGRTITSLNKEVNKGYSTFSFIPGKSNVYIVSAVFEDNIRSIKIISTQSAGHTVCSLRYLGTMADDNSLKSSGKRSSFVYYTGDSLKMTAEYLQFTYNIIDAPTGNTDYTFAFSEILSGEDSKIWKLIRNNSTGRYPMQVGPNDGSGVIWWAYGLYGDWSERQCIFDDQWIFTSEGEMLFRTFGDYWAEGGIFHPELENSCQNVTQMYGPGGEDFSSWGDGDHIFSITEEDVTVTGLGAYIAFLRTGTNVEIKVPQEEITYSLVKLYEGTTDTLIVQCNYMTGGDTPMPAYWRYVLVHYDNPDDEPPMPGSIPEAGFTMIPQGLTVYFSNTSSYAEEYLWDFGDGTTSTEEHPIHTYAISGLYDVSLMAINPSGSNSANRFAMVSSNPLTNELLTGNPWKVKVGEQTVFVGPELGSPDWWSVPLEEMLPGGPWSCLVNDEFIFYANGNYEYKTNGDARNDGYMGVPTGCISDYELLNSGNGAAFRSAIHTYTFHPGTGLSYPYIIFTNGSYNTSAFIGFYKGYYGGENTNPYLPPNAGITTNRYEVLGYADDGVKEYLLISVDLNGENPDGAAWSYILERESTK